MMLVNVQDSPVFNYISSLSPIEQIKSIRNDRSFNSVNFTSPSSLFASPKIGYHRESRFSRCSNQSPDILKPELPLHGKENKKSKGNSEAVQLSDDCIGKNWIAPQLRCTCSIDRPWEPGEARGGGPIDVVVRKNKMRQ
ncbi:hypothetical protein KPL70_015002 [Citrus sinensis]|nr:hypothetical protein KPL70_015002 [Citrus sinensis]